MKQVKFTATFLSRYELRINFWSHIISHERRTRLWNNVVTNYGRLKWPFIVSVIESSWTSCPIVTRKLNCWFVASSTTVMIDEYNLVLRDLIDCVIDYMHDQVFYEEAWLNVVDVITNNLSTKYYHVFIRNDFSLKFRDTSMKCLFTS